MWPNGKKFAFTVVDDTDYSTVVKIRPVYNLLYENGLRTTKTVWVYPSRDNFTGETLRDPDYLDFVRNLKNKGFEIGLHSVGSGVFSREEILSGIEEFKHRLGHYPQMHINHAGNKDNIYWGPERFTLIKKLFKLVSRNSPKFEGEKPGSPLFWGDVCKYHIKYMRNYVVNSINTLKFDPQMPYRVRQKDQYSNYWFSSSDGHTVEEFNDLLSEENIHRLEKEGGCCIVYTHFASGFVENGIVNSEFEKKIKELSSRNGWFVPASEMLDYMLAEKKEDKFISKIYLSARELLWMKDRVIKVLKYKR